MQKSTRTQYKKLLTQLKRWAARHGKALKTLSAADIDAYEQYLINDMQLSPATINTHRAAINKFYAGHGIDITLLTKSTGGRWKTIDTISVGQAEDIIACLPEFYRPILADIYHDLIPPGQAVRRHPSPMADHVTLPTVNRHIAAAAERLGIDKRVRSKMMHQSGIAHAIQRGVKREWVMAQAGIRPSTLARYVRQFGR